MSTQLYSSMLLFYKIKQGKIMILLNIASQNKRY